MSETEENGEDSRVCSNCKKSISTTNFTVHEAHCQRYLVLCEHCREAVHRSDIDQHVADLHASLNQDFIADPQHPHSQKENMADDECREFQRDQLSDHQDTADELPGQPVGSNRSMEQQASGSKGPLVLDVKLPEAQQDSRHFVSPASPTSSPGPSPSPTTRSSSGALADQAPGSRATVRILLWPQGQLVTRYFPLHAPLEQLQSHFNSQMAMPQPVLTFTYEGKQLEDLEHLTLASLGVKANGTAWLKLTSSEPETCPLGNYSSEYVYNMPGVITVTTVMESGERKHTKVVIERPQHAKPYLGGYRHRVSGVEFHNAINQTSYVPPPFLTRDNASCRDTQTVEQRHQRQSTHNHTSTQMTGIGVFVSNLEDKLLEPGPYTTADEREQMILEKIIIIQKYYRRWLAIRRVTYLKECKRKRMEWEEQERMRKMLEREERPQKEFQRKMHPRTKQDFEVLYAALEKWRLEELANIDESLSGAERKAALYMLLERETELLAAIDRHKIEAGTEQTERQIQDFLNKTSAPKKWRGFDGKTTHMITPFTLRAKELRDIYNTLCMKYLTQDERLDILLTLKLTVKEHDCELTRDILELVDREADLLMRGVKDDNLMGLRKRINTLFLQYVKTPTFNPEAANYIKVPQNASKLRKNIYYCPSCNKYLPSSEFNLYSNSRTCGNCVRCAGLDNIARPRVDLTHFRRMLKDLRMAEEKYDDGSKFAFLMQETDMRYLVEYIWSAQSVLSDWRDLHDLVMVRWNKKEHWSPWNCILITTEEAESHDKINNLDLVYGEVFQKKLLLKHTMAYKYYSQLPGMARMLSVAAVQPSSLLGPIKWQRPDTAHKFSQKPAATELQEATWNKQVRLIP